jgi:hypothetical protein
MIFENDTVKEFEYPMDIYYWYIVHPRINREEPILVYEKTWREYLFYHNDVGHPLIKEQVNNTKYLWDGGSSPQYTGIKALGYWVGNNIRYEIIGDRPGHPNNIAHEHTGYCGETQKLVVAAFRSALIPINGVMNYAEDHVWCEFYERNWYHIDGAVNNPYMYTDGWGKDMSSIWAWNGDSSIYDVTSKYIHPEDRITVEFNIFDGYNNPIDGAIVTVLVKGLKDITWYKDYFSDIIDEIWIKIPDIVKGRILNKIYNKLHEKIDEVDEVIEASQVSIWNYTDINGRCKFQLGKDDEYIFLVQKPNLQFPWPISKSNRIKLLSEPENITYKIHFFDYTNKIVDHNNLDEINGEYNGILNLNISSYQLQRNILTRDIGTYESAGIIDFFIVDDENFELYKNGKKFDCYYFQELKDSEVNFKLNNQDYYLIFRNHAHMINMILDYEIFIESSDEIDNIEIVTPSTNIFEVSTFSIGTEINISGISTSNSIKLSINNITNIIPAYNGTWEYQWNTTNLEPNEYLITAANNNVEDIKSVKLIDNIPPKIEIFYPNNFEIFNNDIITIEGIASDNFNLKKIEIIIDENNPIIIDGVKNWNYDIDLTNYATGEHSIRVIVYDDFGLTNNKEIMVIKNDSDIEYRPIINSLFIYPQNPTNASNIIVYSNVTSESLFSIKEVIIYYMKSNNVTQNKMFRYGDFPPQERHIEDDIQDISNDPIYGIELGKFETGDIISFWIEAVNSANNKNISSIFSFEVQ